MKKKRTGILLIFLAALLSGLFFIHRKTSETTKVDAGIYEIYSRHYVLITDREDSDFWDRVYAGALEEGKENGVYVERFGENLAEDYSRNELLKLAIQASVDGIIVPGDEDEETVELLNSAVEKGIPVVTVLNDSTGSLRQCFVGNNSYNLGQDYGHQILEILAEREEEAPAKVLVLADENRIDVSQNLVLFGIRETLERTLGEDHMVSVDTALVDNTRSFSSEESIRDIFLNQEELPDILVCLNAVYTRCAYQAAVDYNKVGIVQMLGYYDSDVILDAVAKNIIYCTVALDTEQMGRLCVQALNEYEETGYTNSYMAVDTRLITAAEADRLVRKEQ